MAKPVLSKIAAFDCTVGTTVTFTWTGAQAYGNELIIRTSEDTDVIVYDYTIENSMSLKHVMDLDEGTTADTVNGTFENGVQYQATIIVYDREGNASTTSDAVTFWCFTTPTITVTNTDIMDDDGNYLDSSSRVISMASFPLGFYYYQDEGEPLNEYYFQLYDESQTLLIQSDTFYGSSSNEYCEYTFSGLSDGLYYFNIAVSTSHGFITETGLILFYVKFDKMGVGALVVLTDLGNSNIQIGSNYKIQDTESNPEDPDYINDAEIDLRKDDTYVNFFDGFEVSGDFELKARIRMIQDSFAITCTGSDGDVVEVVYLSTEVEYDYGTVTEYYFALIVNGEVVATTDTFEAYQDDQWINLVARCEDGVYSISYTISNASFTPYRLAYRFWKTTD